MAPRALVDSPLNGCSFLPGNMKQIAQRDGWGYIRDLIETYGPVSTLNGFFGVRPLSLSRGLSHNVCDPLVDMVACLRCEGIVSHLHQGPAQVRERRINSRVRPSFSAMTGRSIFRVQINRTITAPGPHENPPESPARGPNEKNPGSVWVTWARSTARAAVTHAYALHCY